MNTIDNIKSILLGLDDFDSLYCLSKVISSDAILVSHIGPSEYGSIFLYSPVKELTISVFFNDGNLNMNLRTDYLGISGLYRLDYEEIEDSEDSIYMESYIPGPSGNDETFHLIQFLDSSSKSDATFEQKTLFALEDISSNSVEIDFFNGYAFTNYNRSFTELDLIALKEKASLYFGCSANQIGVDFKYFEILDSDSSSTLKSIGLQSNTVVCLLDAEFVSSSPGLNNNGQIFMTSICNNNSDYTFTIGDKIRCHNFDKFNLCKDIYYNKHGLNWSASLHCIVLTFRQ